MQAPPLAYYALILHIQLLEALCALIVLLATDALLLAQQPLSYVLQDILRMPDLMSVMNVHLENTVLRLEHNGAPHVLLVPFLQRMLSRLVFRAQTAPMPPLHNRVSASFVQQAPSPLP